MPSPGTACSSPAPPTCRSPSPRTPSPARYGRCSTDERPPSPRPHHALMTQKVMSQRMILLVEDNPDDEALTRRALAKNNIQNEVRVARDGAEALDLLFGTGGHAVAPELVLLDLKLPKVYGLEVLRRIRADERTRLLPVVILTSSREERDLVSGYGLGANSYIRKPVDFGQFVEAVRQLGLYWLALKRPPPPPPPPPHDPGRARRATPGS